MIKINGIEYTNVQAGYQVRESKTGELDTCFCILHLETKPNFKLFDIAEMDNKKWLIGVINTVKKKNKYQINLTLYEPTLLLEKYILSPCAFTNPTDTLRQQIEKLFYKVETLRTGETPRFKLSQNLSDLLSGRPGEDFIYSERMTLREILDDMLSSLGYRSYVIDLNNEFTDITIDYIDLNEKSNDIKTLSRITSEDEMWSGQYYANELDVNIQNVQSKRRSEIIHDWQTLKPVEITQVNDKSIKLVVDYPIEEITSVKVSFEADFTFTSENPPESDIRHDIPFEIDITDLFIERELYDVLDVVEQGNYVPYERGNNKIGVLDTHKSFLFSYSKLRPYLADKASIIAKNILEILEGREVTSVYVDIPSTSEIADSVLFQVRYIPFLDFYYKESKDLDDLSKKITTVYNQTDRNIDLDKFSNAIRALASRTGNEELTVDFIVKDKSEMLNLGDRIENDYSLVVREYQVFNSFIKGKYTFLKNYDGNITTRLSRERRLYNIPDKNLVERKVLIKDNLLVSTEPFSFVNDSSLSTDTLHLIVKSFEDNPNNDYMDRILFHTRDGLNNRYPETGKEFSLNFVAKPISKSLVWQMKTYDNYSVGLSTSKQKWLGRDVYLNPYTDSEGEFESITFRFIKSNMKALTHTNMIELGKSLPVAQIGLFPDYVEKTYSNQTSSQSFIVKKDRLEILNFIYQLEAKPKTNNIIIGNYFMDFMNLLEYRDHAQLRLWVSPGETYNVNDVVRCKGTMAVSSYNPVLNGNTAVTTSYNVALIDSWAIGTQDGRLLLAVNNKKQPLNTIYFGISRDK